jgi:hypothetical protein
MTNLQQPTSDSVRCVSCNKPCPDGEWMRRYYRALRPEVQCPLAEAIATPTKDGRNDDLQITYQKPKQQHGSSAAGDVPLDDYLYCHECFLVLNYFFEHVMEERSRDLMEKMHGFETSKPKTSSNDAQDEVPAWLNHYDEFLLDWYKCFKNMDTIYGTDICKIMRSVVETNNYECVPLIMFESLAIRTPDFPVRVRALTEARFVCVLCCRRAFKSDRQMQEHKKDMHKDATLNYKSIAKQEHTPTVREPSTDLSPKVSIKRKHESITSHEATSEATWYCSVCQEIFSSQDGVDAHNMSKHGGESTFVASRARSTFTCVTCNRKFDNQHGLDDHTSDGRHMQPPPPVVLNSQIKQDMAAFRDAIRQEYKPRVMPGIPIKQESATHQVAIRETPRRHNITCDPCKRVFGTQEALMQHNKDKHTINGVFSTEFTVRGPPPVKRKKDSHPIEHRGLNPPTTSPPTCQKASSMNWEITPNETKQERVNEFTMESHCQPSSKVPDVIEYGSDDSVSEYTEEDSEGEPVETAEDESESEPDVDMDYYTLYDVLNEHSIWPDYPQPFSDTPCLFRTKGCREIFSRGSEMIKHVEAGDCIVSLKGDYLDVVFTSDKIGRGARQLYDPGYDMFKCPNCKESDDGQFYGLSSFLEHAESNACDLKVCTGPLGRALVELLDYADRY